MNRPHLDEKSLATLRARAALQGLALHRFETDAGGEAFLLEKWGLSRTVDSPEAIDDFIKRIGGPQA